MKGTAFWVFHGADDKTVPVDRSRDMVAALKKAGATTKYSEYKGVGHGSWSRAYADAELWKWMFNQKRAKN
jgi:predicted peptidase